MNSSNSKILSDIYNTIINDERLSQYTVFTVYAPPDTADYELLVAKYNGITIKTFFLDDNFPYYSDDIYLIPDPNSKKDVSKEESNTPSIVNAGIFIEKEMHEIDEEITKLKREVGRLKDLIGDKTARFNELRKLKARYDEIKGE